ncbi:MAG: hypothetical protein D3915_15715 [Candidatus Electrothrix sp. AU1_5]|nr:hypothetical protein [Candidatus Electrothrix gigas]
MKSKIITLIVILLISVNYTHANDEPPLPLTQTVLFGVNLAGTFTENNLPELIQLSNKISAAEKAYSLLRSKLPDPSLATLPDPSPAVNEMLDELSELDDYISTAKQELQAGKVINGIGDIDISKLIQRVSLGIDIASNIYSTYDILKKTMNGGASTTEKENYIVSGLFSVIGLSAYLQPPPVAGGVVFKGAGYIGLGYAALQLGAAWGEYVNGITVTEIIDGQVQNTFSHLELVDELARVILEEARNGKTAEELNMSYLVSYFRGDAMTVGIEAIELLESPEAKISHITTGNVKHADNAKGLIGDIVKMLGSDKYSDVAFQDIYQAGRLAYLSDNALTALDQDDISSSIAANKNPWILFFPAILAGASNNFVDTTIDDFESYDLGGSYIDVSDWTVANSCHPVVIEEKSNKFIQSSSCFDGQGIKRPFVIDASYINSEMKIQFSGAITEGSGNNSSAELYFLTSDNYYFSFGLDNWPSGGYEHQLRVIIGGSHFPGVHLSPGIWYDMLLNIDWTFSTSEGFGLACLQYKETGSSKWLTDNNLCNMELQVKDVSEINYLGLRMDGISGRLGRVDDIKISYSNR